MVNTRNILLIGRTGSGKSTLGNVLINKNDNFDEVFAESSHSVSETRIIKEGTVEVDISRDGNEKVKYRIIDTIGLGDTKLTPQGVLTRLAEVASRVKNEGLNHIFFVTQGRFSKEEIEAYDLLSSIIFDKDVLKYTTIVRTSFPSFEDKNKCDNDRAALRIENAALAHILGSVNVIYVDNPPLEGRSRMIEMNKEIREESRKRVLTYLAGCEGNYRPNNIDTLDERVHDYKTNEQKLKDKMKEMDEDRKRQEKEFHEKLANMEEGHRQALRENQIHFDKKLAEETKKNEEKLEQTKKKLGEESQKKLDDAERRAKDRERDAEVRHQQDLRRVEDSLEKQKRDHQDDLKKSREEADNLRKQMNEKKDNSDIVAQLEALKADDKEVRLKELEIKEEKERREQDRLDKIHTADQERQDKLNNARVEKINQEKEAARKKASLEQEKKAAGVFETIGKGVVGWNNS